jgi:hypothetical protein
MHSSQCCCTAQVGAVSELTYEQRGLAARHSRSSQDFKSAACCHLLSPSCLGRQPWCYSAQKPIQLLHSTQAVLLTTGIEVCVEAREHVCDKMLSHLGKSSGRLACTDHTGVNAYTSRECIHSDLAIRRRAQYPTRRLPNFLCLHGVSSFIHYFLST